MEINKLIKNVLSESEGVMFKLFERYGEKILYIKIIDDKIIEEND